MVVAEFTLFVTTHSYWFPLRPRATPVRVRVCVPEPATPPPSARADQDVPPLAETIHRYEGVGLPLAATANAAAPPEATVTETGSELITGAV